MRTQLPGRVAWSSVGLTVTLAVLAIVLTVRAVSPGAPDRNQAPLPFLLVVLATALVYAAVGALVASRRPTNPVGWSFCAIGLLLALLFAVKAWAELALFAEPGSHPDPTPAIWLMEVLSPVQLLAPTVVLLFFPTGSLPSPRWRLALWTASGAAGLAAVSGAVRPGEIEASDFPGVLNPLGVGGAPGAAASALTTAAMLAGTATLVLALVSQGVRYRRADGRGRQQIRWVAFPALLNVLFWTAAEFVPEPLGTALWLAGFAALAAIPVGAAVAILRHRLYEIDLIIDRTLVYGVLTACVIAVYVVMVAWLGALLQVEDDLAVSLVATGVVAVMFAPLRAWLQQAVDRVVFGRRGDPYTILSQLGQRLAAATPEAALAAVADTVAAALATSFVAVRTAAPGGTERVAAESGRPTGDSLTVPLVHQREVVGSLVLEPAGRIRDADRPLLDDLARQASAAVHAARLTAELQHSRERLVAGREEERRRLRRDLHDGLGPQLAAQTLKIGSARALYTRRPEQADALLAELETDTELAMADLRRVIEGLRPPALDELGLMGALREEVGRFRDSGVALEVSAGPLPPLPAAVEVAAYRIAAEAVTNVVRHARARRCCVRLAADDGLVVEVTDDGTGLRPDATAGVGLTSMRERAAELGGTCDVSTADGGGTRVRARIPVRAAVTRD